MKNVLLMTLALSTLVLSACGDKGGGGGGVPPGEVYPENNDSVLNGRTARCSVRAMSLDDRRSSRGGQVFKSQRREGVREINWEPNYEQTFDIFGMFDKSYGVARWTLSPAGRRDRGAQGNLVLSQNGSQISVRSGLGGFVNLKVSNYYSNKEVDFQCISHSSFRRWSGEEGRVRCSVREGNERRGREEYVTWNGGQPQERELWRNPHSNENVSIRLKSNSVLEIAASNIDSGKSVVAQGTANEGLELRYRGRSSHSDLVVSCAPASK